MKLFVRDFITYRSSSFVQRSFTVGNVRQPIARLAPRYDITAAGPCFISTGADGALALKTEGIRTSGVLIPAVFVAAAEGRAEHGAFRSLAGAVEHECWHCTGQNSRNITSTSAAAGGAERIGLREHSSAGISHFPTNLPDKCTYAHPDKQRGDSDRPPRQPFKALRPRVLRAALGGPSLSLLTRDVKYIGSL